MIKESFKYLFKFIEKMKIYDFQSCVNNRN